MAAGGGEGGGGRLEPRIAGGDTAALVVACEAVHELPEAPEPEEHHQKNEHVHHEPK